ncbi:methionine gamma-lyase [Pradoshia sp. D12]|uniref:methionine gamma-lyase n=1 Tax=Bacillaceae TaxID=186817 RepID=UPI00080ACC0A|nr:MULTISPECIES: methionine gamma-lyase [Bacillaceae]OCA82622.1 methionine gamma-lyase [Bacillus sp. FJAT-27986]QFK70172.1 methionine gamma-lyase [Pradoshia sp. D12]TPF70951.1 methionine gamma-lyase [Bacillus sp. D12]
MNKKYTHFETAAIHAGYESNEHQGSLSMPIYQTSTFTFESAEQGEQRFAGTDNGFIYSRLGNPTVRSLEEKIAVLEGAEEGIAFGSGMAAVSAVLMELTKANDHILCSLGIYGCTFDLLVMMKEKYNIHHDFSPMETEEQIQELIKPETTCIFVETPINPTMRVIDLEMVARVAKRNGIPVIVDNTFPSPYLQQPLQLGCDIVVHSATKYICGHGDVVAGLAAGSREFISRVRKTMLKDVGGIMAPFDAWLLLRGIKTLPIRMDRHSENAQKIYEKLKEHPKVERIYYPGDKQNVGYEAAMKQMRQPGGIIAFEIKGSKEDAQAFLNRMKLIKIAVSLGDVETLICHPASMTHAIIPESERLEMGVTDQLLRVSVGLENWQDLWGDIKQALGND